MIDSDLKVRSDILYFEPHNICEPWIDDKPFSKFSIISICRKIKRVSESRTLKLKRILNDNK